MVYGITRSKDEVDIIEGSMRRALEQVDHVIIGDNSTDGSWEILERLVADGLPITLHRDTKLNVEQRDVMTAYAHDAREAGAEWVQVFDVDESWYRPDGQRIGEFLEGLPPEVMIATAWMRTHWCTALDDPAEADPAVRMGWCDIKPGPLPKVACRTHPHLCIDHGNHAAWYEGIRDPLTVRALEGRHYPYRLVEQFIKRIEGAWPSLRDSGLPEAHGSHTRAYGRCLEQEGHDGLRAWWGRDMFSEDPESNPEMVYDPWPPASTRSA